MNKEVVRLFKKIIIFIIPIFLWILIVILIDPFNYFNNNNIIKQKYKEKSSKQLNSLLYNCIDFANQPTQNIIIGDSRVRKLSTSRIKELTNKDYYILYSNAAKLNEMIDLFWFANSKTKLKNVVLGVNFNLYNQYAYANRVADIAELMSNPLIYIFNKNTFESVFLAFKYEFITPPKKIIKNKKKVWGHTLDIVAKNQYGKYAYPKDLLKKLKDIHAYCEEKNINLTLIVLPHHKDFHDKLLDYNLEEEEKRFKKEIKNIGTVIDFDYKNIITINSSSFGDPLHTTDSVSNILVEEIFSDSLVIGKKL